MKWLGMILIAGFVGCTTQTTPIYDSSRADIRYGTPKSTPGMDEEIPLPHAQGVDDPCTADCEHWCFSGQYFRSHRHSPNCGHYFDETLKRWRKY